MELKFTDTFFKSLKKISSRRMIHWRIYDFFRYDLIRFFRNLWLFRKNLWNYNNYNGANSILPWVKTSLDDIVGYIEKYGHEESKSRAKKVEKMKRLSYLLDVFLKDDYIKLATEELGPIYNTEIVFEPTGDGVSYEMIDKGSPEEKKHNIKVIKRSKEIEEKHWREIIDIIKGPDYEKIYNELENFYSELENFEDQYDGSDMRSWWD
jgi:hypothetical protein